jgi:hypothetical protein
LGESCFERCRPRAFLVKRRLASGEEGAGLGERLLGTGPVSLQFLVERLQ